MMILFTHAARMAMVVMDPYLSSRPLAEALLNAPPGEMIVDDQYYSFSSVFFYADRSGLLLNGRVNNLEYGSNAPGAPQVFIDDPGFKIRWESSNRYYLLAANPAVPRLTGLVGAEHLHVVKESGGKFLFCNQAQPTPLSRERAMPILASGFMNAVDLRDYDPTNARHGKNAFRVARSFGEESSNRWRLP
jgi:hypothetical protein